jgi:murein DD-endopeptidase MepM/ murein hydrolase activator NlpD
MKIKMPWLFVVILLMISGMTFLYLQTDHFEKKNIEALVLDGQILNEQESEVNDLMDFILSPQHKQISIDKSAYSKELEVEKKLGSSEKYLLYFDGDYRYVDMMAVSEKKYYRIEAPVSTYLYMHESLEDFYDYTQAQHFDLFLDQALLESQESSSWRYTKADGLWEEVYNENENDVKTYEIDQALPLKVTYDLEPTSLKLRVYQDNTMIYEDETMDIGYVPKDNGIYRYEVEGLWSGNYFSGKQMTTFNVKVKHPVTMSLSQESFEQGENIFLLAESIEDPDSLRIESDYWDQLAFEQQGDVFMAMIPSTYYTSPGLYDMDVYGDGETFHFTFELKARDFSIQYLTVSSNTVAKTQTTEAYDEYHKYYYEALQQNVYQASILDFKEAFSLPTQGRLTTEFGLSRYVNDKPTSYPHAGLDIASEKGTPVEATYQGQVVMSRYLTVTGNSIVISHGHGIFSTYFHLDSRNVEVGDLVEGGDLIGLMGTTGFSTGSHLHFGISYYRMNLEPGYFLYGQAVTYDNYKDLFGRDE